VAFRPASNQQQTLHFPIMTSTKKTYGFTLKTDNGKLYSWIVEAADRKAAFWQLQSGDKPDSLIILTCSLTDAQQQAWIQASVEHGGFDDQMASSILNVY
jgi:hypothetical protein